MTQGLPLLLASASPRRRDLLTAAGVSIEIQPAGLAETPLPGEKPENLAVRLASEKALAVARRVGPAPPRRVLGADTLVVVDGDVLGKPTDPEDALRLLRRLMGRRHRVVTGVAVVESDGLAVKRDAVTSVVVMRPADDAELRAYVAGGEPLDKAGAYALQGEGARFVTAVEGSRSNVIGLPLEETLALLGEAT